jgi:hypothetical protein
MGLTILNLHRTFVPMFLERRLKHLLLRQLNLILTKTIWPQQDRDWYFRARFIEP